MAQQKVISFLSDLGLDDESVGVCKAIMMQQAPEARIIDITHQVKPFDVRAGALALTRAIQFLPSGVVLAAVDPSSPSTQRYIAVELENTIFIGPDNGILAPAAQLLGEPIRVHEITNPEYRIEAPGGVFAARDIMAPAAGVVASGIDISELGAQIPLEQLVPGMLQLSRHDEGGAFLGEVWSIDRFENVQTNITPEELTASGLRVGDSVVVRINENDFMAKFVERYADLAKSQLGLLVDSTGMLSIVKNLDFAARELGVSESSALAIMPQGATITGRDVTVETVQAMSDAQAEGDASGGVGSMPISPVYEAQVIDPIEEDYRASAFQNPEVQTPAAPIETIAAPVQYEAPVPPVPAPYVAPAEPAPAPYVAPVEPARPAAPVFEAPLAPSREETFETTVAPAEFDTRPSQPLQYDAPAAPAFETEAGITSGSVNPFAKDNQDQFASHKTSHPLDSPVQYVAPVAPAAPVYEAPQSETPQFAAPEPQETFVQPAVQEPVSAFPNYEAPQAPVQYSAPVQPETPVAPAAPAPAAPVYEAPQFAAPFPPQAPVQFEAPVPPAAAPQAPAPYVQPTQPVQQQAPVQQPAQVQPQQQPVDQIPTGNVFDLFKIDSESDEESDSDSYNPPQQ